jgi:fructokinase
MGMKLPQLVVFGEALTDFIREDNQRWRSAPGGSCWNVARVGARLGVATGFGGTVSQDTFEVTAPGWFIGFLLNVFF